MISPILYHDAYKADHRSQYPKNTTKVYSNFTPRISRIDGIDHVVVFGIQYFVLHYLGDLFGDEFFGNPREMSVNRYRRVVESVLGKGAVNFDHIGALHDLGYLPIEIKALPEGTLCPLKVPLLTITNSHPDFAWVPNFLETLISNVLWHPITSATIAYEYRKILEEYAKKTSDMPEFVKFQGHDFSMRGQSSLESSLVSGAAHLTSFVGTDTIPAIDLLSEYYYGDVDELIGASVPATEHSVQCLGGQATEFDTYKRLITEVYPKGIISIVSDTWDYWNCLTSIIGGLKDVIMARDGKVVVRPDSGDPETILCGDLNAEPGSPEHKGTFQILWEIFGGTINSKGYKQLDPHIGVIYGDSITLERCKSICARMEKMGFASTNMVFGIGSYTYQYVTRDTFGLAMKATYGIVDGIPQELFKDPITDKGVKKSAKGLLQVIRDETGKIVLKECVSEEEERQGLLRTIFINGESTLQYSLNFIRAQIDGTFREKTETYNI